MPYLVLNQRELRERSGVTSVVGEWSRTDALNLMEKQGWEFMLATDGPSTGQLIYYFRAKAAEGARDWD